MNPLPAAGEASPAADLWTIETHVFRARCALSITIGMLDRELSSNDEHITGQKNCYYLPPQTVEELSFIANTAFDSIEALKVELDLAVDELKRARAAETKVTQ